MEYEPFLSMCLLAVVAVFALLFIVYAFKNLGEKGEIVAEEEGKEDKGNGTGDEDLEFPLEDLDDVELNLDGEEDDENKEEEKEKEKSAKKDKQEDKDKKPEITLEQLQEQLDQKENKIKDLNVALHQERQAKKALKEGKDDEPALTEAQLRQLFSEHQDDPDTMFNLMKYMVKQGVKGTEEKAVDAAEISQRKKQLDDLVTQTYPDMLKDTSELRTDANTIKSKLRIDDHPFGDFLAISAMVHRDMGQLLKNEYERGRQEALGDKADQHRKKTVKKASLTPPGKGSDKSETALPANIEEVSSRIGLSKRGKEIYGQLRKKSR